MKRFVLIFLSILFLFAGCAGTKTNEESTTDAETVTAEDESISTEKATVNVSLLKGPTGMGAAVLLENDEKGTAAADYNLTLAGAPDVLQAALINNELDMAALPTNVAAVLNKKTEGNVQLLAVNTLGVIYLMSNDESVTTVSDLQGKTIQAQLPENFRRIKEKIFGNN